MDIFSLCYAYVYIIFLALGIFTVINTFLLNPMYNRHLLSNKVVVSHLKLTVNCK